jgi:hypothetical protein
MVTKSLKYKYFINDELSFQIFRNGLTRALCPEQTQRFGDEVVLLSSHKILEDFVLWNCKLANINEVTHWIDPASCFFLFSAWKPILAQDG